MPGEGFTHGPRAKEMHAAVTTGSAKSSGIPRAMFDGLYAFSPGTGLIAPVIRATRQRRREFDASSGASGPHDFTVRIRLFVGVA
jgi:hypothetical protein